MLPAALDEAVFDSLDACARFLSQGGWRGRENELVNLFVFGYLLPRLCPPAGNLDPTQIGIEVAVPQLAESGKRRKSDVRKDLVLWRRARTTNWTPLEPGVSRVLAVMEWKSLNNIGIRESAPRKRREHEHDVQWLQASTRLDEEMTGFAVIADLRSESFSLSCTVIRSGIMMVNREFRGRSG